MKAQREKKKSRSLGQEYQQNPRKAKLHTERAQGYTRHSAMEL